jgi:cob(I)alamin adenosyltransferase
MRKGLIFVIKGRGKGKTTSALGMLLRAWGRDMQVALLQFIKNPEVESGEHIALRRMGLEVVTLGSGFTWVEDNAEKNRVKSLELWALAIEKIASGKYDMLVLDEFAYPLEYGWIPLPEVLEILKTRPEGLHIVITGRFPPDELIELADSVVEIISVKHHLEKGTKAQPGIEF